MCLYVREHLHGLFLNEFVSYIWVPMSYMGFVCFTTAICSCDHDILVSSKLLQFIMKACKTEGQS